MVTVEMFPAREGDCFLITLLEQDYRILVDGGTAQTYNNYLRERLLELSHEGKKIDLLIVTHIDNDHIGGIISLIKENGCNEESRIIRIKEIWHNSYRHFTDLNNNEISFSEKEILSSIISNGSALDEGGRNRYQQEISALQGTTLAGFLYKGKYNWNSLYAGKAVNCDFRKDILIGRDCSIKVLSPNTEILNKLKVVWRSELMKKNVGFKLSNDPLFDDAYEFAMRYLVDVGGNTQSISETKVNEGNIEALIKINSKVDNKITNRASISFILYCHGKRLLFLGDLSTDFLEKKELDNSFDLIKIPHHGSTNNVDFDFLTRYRTKNYLISTDGSRHKQPDVDVIAKIIASNKDEKHLYFNYIHNKLDIISRADILEEYMCHFHYPQGEKIVTVNV